MEGAAHFLSRRRKEPKRILIAGSALICENKWRRRRVDSRRSSSESQRIGRACRHNIAARIPSPIGISDSRISNRHGRRLARTRALPHPASAVKPLRGSSASLRAFG